MIQQQRGELLLTDEQLGQWRALLETRAAWLQSRGATYRFFVAPNPHSVYPDMLPFDIAPGNTRPPLQLIDYLKAAGSSARLLYPLDDLVRRRDSPAFSQTDTHWTDLGAFIAYEALIDEIGNEVDVRRLTLVDLRLDEDVRPGDLGVKVNPKESSLHVFATPTNPAARLTDDNRVWLNGRRIDYECPAAGETACLVFGDSFAHQMLQFLAESFGRLVFAHLPTLDRDLVMEVEPDVVVSILNERFVIRVPVDDGAKTLAQCAAEKRAGGAVHPPRQLDGNRVDSPRPLHA